MSRRKLTEKQTELIALLPQGLPAMSDGCKIVLANIVLWYGTEYAKENGVMYRTNQDMMNDCELTEPTIIKAVRTLENLGLIETSRGQRGEASEYRLTQSYTKINTEFITKIKSEPITKIKNDVILVKQDNELNINDLITKINTEFITKIKDYMTNKEIYTAIEGLTLAINELRGEFNALKNELKISYFSTDTESDTDITIKEVGRQRLGNQGVEKSPNPETVSPKESEIISTTETATPRHTNTPKNDFVTKAFQTLTNKIQRLYDCNSREIFNALNDEICNYFQTLNDQHRDKFTEKQWEVIVSKLDKWEKISKGKQKLFNGSDDNEGGCPQHSSTVKDDKKEGDALKRCKPFKREDAISWASKEVEKYYDFKSFENALWERSTRKYGSNWMGNDTHAMRFYNICTEFATNYFRDLNEKTHEQTKPTVETSDNGDDDIAPWEDPNTFKSIPPNGTETPRESVLTSETGNLSPDKK